LGNQPQPGDGGGEGPEMTGAPSPMEPDLDGRSVANMPEPSQAPAQ
jgi:hypothetical protein